MPDNAIATPKTEANLRPARSAAALLEVFLTALRLGLTSFGGPIAHLGYFQREYVERKRWLDERTFADLVALAQFLPGPASSQTGIAIGMIRGGLAGGVLAWLGFTLPSAVALALFASLVHGYDVTRAGWLHGLLIVAVAVIAQAVWNLARKLAPDPLRASLAFVAAIIVLLWPSAFGQVGIIVAGGLFGWAFLPKAEATHVEPLKLSFGRGAALLALTLFFGGLVLLPLVREWTGAPALALFDSFYRVGSLVFGGGHVVLPLLQAEVVPPGWVTNAQFLAGYGAAQAVPGPLFTFSAYLGSTIGGWSDALLAVVAIFLPSFFLIVGALPFWSALRARPGFQAALAGINAVVVGLLLAALYHPVWTSTIHAPLDLALALVDFALLAFWKRPSWLVVIVSAVGGSLIAALG
ncbi:MAG TPA: chromate efflux transporter [Limnochordia bacterium]|nr:chromate efflux transporter [Limnochordia bacterium]